jgi:transposase
VQQTDPARLVFVDECGTHTSMTRRHARAPRGTRARGAVPRNRGPVTTLITGLSLGGMSPAMTVEGGTTAAVFAAYLEKVLLPALSAGTVIVVDNVGAHQPERIRALVAAVGCQLVFLPAYSPDLSPIEEAFSKIKTLVEAAAARTRAALDAAIALALAAVTVTDAAGWFAHTGYLTPQAAENRCAHDPRRLRADRDPAAGRVRSRHERLPPPRTWPAGPASARATTAPAAGPAPGAPGTARSPCASR